MKVEKTVNWLSKALFGPDRLGNPIVLEIADYKEMKTPKGTDRILVGKYQDGTLYSVNVFGEQLNALIDQLGDDSDKWLTRKIKVMRLTGLDGKDKRQITVI